MIDVVVSGQTEEEANSIPDGVSLYIYIYRYR